MSVNKRNSNQGPIQIAQKSQSKRSLYSENSYNSNDEQQSIPKNIDNNKNTPFKEQLVSQQINWPSKKQKDKQIQRHQYNLNQNYQQNHQEFTKKQIMKPETDNKPKFLGQFNSFKTMDPHHTMNIGTNRYQNNEAGRPDGFYGLNSIQSKNQHRSSFYAEKERMLRSSQGGRWFRSQSLMQGNQSMTQNAVNSGVQLKNFHPHGSKYSQLLQKFLKHYYSTEKQLHSRWSKFKISMDISLQEIKNRMEAFLEKRIDLSNIPIDRPQADWNQQKLAEFYSNYQPILLNKISIPNKEGGKKANQLGQKPVTVLKKYKNCVYYGPIVNGKKHGFGYLHYFTGRFFEGLFLDDQKYEGFQMDDSQLYLGEYKKNQRHGQGILKTNQFMVTGTFTNGQFRMNAPNINKSQGVQIYDGFKIQFSSIKIYSRTAILIEKNSSSDIYIGETNQSELRNGSGLQIFANGDIYLGIYDQGVPEGYGQYYWQSGAFYRGQFLSGMRHGKGVWMMINGDKYEGEYMNDKKNGKGVYIWKTGDCYEGSFQNDYRHGYGEMFWRDGTEYKGNWLNGIQSNKIIKLEESNQRNQPKLPKTRQNQMQQVKTSFRTIQPKQIKNATSADLYKKDQSKVSSQEKNSKRVPLEKLKAMLNPTNNKN